MKLTSTNVRPHHASMTPPVGIMLVTSPAIVCQDMLVWRTLFMEVLVNAYVTKYINISLYKWLRNLECGEH